MIALSRIYIVVVVNKGRERVHKLASSPLKWGVHVEAVTTITLALY